MLREIDLRVASDLCRGMSVRGEPADGSSFYSLTGFPGYSIQLFAGGTVLAQDNNTLAPAEGTFALSTVQFTSGGADAGFGQALTIRLLNLNLPNSGIEVNFDDVQLTAIAIPEPSTYALTFGAIAFGFGALHRRRPLTTRHKEP